MSTPLSWWSFSRNVHNIVWSESLKFFPKRIGGLIIVGLALAISVARADEPAPSFIPFTIKLSHGSPRPIVIARVNGHPISMMMHSNASFFAQLKHRQAAEFGVTLSGKHRAYGIDRPGHVSPLGFDRGSAHSLSVGSSVNNNVPVSVFEIPQERLGMLGVKWIQANRVVMDYGHRKAFVSPTPECVLAERDSIRHAGYVGIPIEFDPVSQRYLVKITINRVSRRMVVASASELTIDNEFAFSAHLPLGRNEGSGGGPTGTSVKLFSLARPLQIHIGRWVSAPVKVGSIEDTYAYMARARPTISRNALGGYLGGAFLMDTAAVIDFGSRFIYLPNATRRATIPNLPPVCVNSSDR